MRRIGGASHENFPMYGLESYGIEICILLLLVILPLLDWRDKNRWK